MVVFKPGMPARPEPIMLFKSPVMLLNNALKFSLLCSNYALLYPIMLHKFSVQNNYFTLLGHNDLPM